MNNAQRLDRRTQPGCTHEQISRLADGDLDGSELQHVLDSMADPATQDCWHAYQVIGDVMRAPEFAACRLDVGFLEQLRPHLRGSRSAAPRELLAPQRRARPAANDRLFGWKLAAGFASIAAVASIGWSLLNTINPAAGVLAGANEAAETQVAGASLDANRQFAPFLMAHWHANGGAAFGATRDFVRNASYQGPQR